MNIFQKLKTHLNLNTQQLTQKTDISRFIWRRLETGQGLPTPEQALAIQKVCGHAIPNLDQIPDKAITGHFERKRYEIPTVAPGAWLRLKNQLRLTPAHSRWQTLDWAQQFIPCDVDLEAKCWWPFILAGAKPILENPHLLGFDLHPMIGGDDRALCSRVLPGLAQFEGEEIYALWPQVRLRTSTISARLDALVWCKIANRTAWSDLEVDGDGHNSLNDARRTQALGLPTIRITKEVIASNQVLDTFLSRCREITRP